MPTTRSHAKHLSKVGSSTAEGSTSGKPRKRPREAQEAEPAPSAKKPRTKTITPCAEDSNIRTVETNRAPVLTLWAAVVAQRQGYTFDEGLSFGRWIAGTLAQSKGRSLGIYEPREKSAAEMQQRQKRDLAMGVRHVDVFGMHVPAVETSHGEVRAVSEGKSIDPGSTVSYLQRSLGKAGYAAAKEAMEGLAGSIPVEEIGRKCYHLYEEFRPEWKGWGVKGHLDLDRVRSLAEHV